MAELSEKLSEQQQENSDLKVQLNAIQQAKVSLELEVRQKEEIVIKTQAEALKNEQTLKQEIKQLQEKLKENSKWIETDISKEMEDQLDAKAREAKAVAELNQKTKKILNYEKILEDYDNTIAARYADYKKLKEEHESAIRHLANIELAFSDVHQKYEKTKALVLGFKSNEDTLKIALQDSEETFKQQEERYESLKAHAKGQIEKSNKEILKLRDKYEMDVNKLKAIIKRLEIKCSSLQVSLKQKTEECAALSALCEEVTGKKV